MLAIAESGSTKCEWVILGEDFKPVQRVSTIGFNPDFHSPEDVQKELNSKIKEFKQFSHITELYFYGAGCSSDRLKGLIHHGLSEVFTEANITVDHDLTAAAYSLYNGRPMVACILGTGSNSCYFDGNEVKEKIPALGFLLGDEGGGGYFGKQLLRAYFYRLLPSNVAQDFFNTYALSWEDVRKELYKTDHANVYAASFMPFIAKHAKDPYINKMLKEGFRQFVQVHVNCFEPTEETEICFVGSVAYFFKDILAQILEEENLLLGRIIKSPIDQLVQYHLKSIHHSNSLK